MIGLNKLETSLAIVIINDEEKRTQVALMMIFHILEDPDQMLISETSIQGRSSLNKVVGTRPF